MTTHEPTHHEKATVTEAPVAQAAPSPAKTSGQDALAIVSMILGIVSLMGPGLILGIPAIVLAAIALKKNQGSKGFSITGLITGIVSTLVSLLLLGFFTVVMIWALNNPNSPYLNEQYMKDLEKNAPSQQQLEQQLFDNLKI